ncbi:hypothetical protein E3A20_11080 [Planctomyces bekefii]|uniref:RNA polymerase sigma-70 ECF-like HTH domain-containing protein n=1 Tax=Planctomyces bekefii TaxID=1653850 RepID=A0A5C6M6H0_9PLAN|nr:hypothetical protein E3A20_11080 [Planctomyces bekefii]
MPETAAGENSQSQSLNSISCMLEQIRQGDLSEREVLIDRLINRLYSDSNFAEISRLAYRRLGAAGARQGDEADVMQESMLVLYRRARRGSLDTVHRRERLFGLLRLIVANRARAFRRRAEAAKRGGDLQFVSLDQSPGDGSTICSLHSGPGDPDSQQDHERLELADLLQTLLERCEQEFPENLLIGRVFELLLEGCGSSEIRRETGASRSQLDAAIDAIRGVAKRAFGREWDELKQEFHGR